MNNYTFLFNLSGVILKKNIYEELLTAFGIALPNGENEQPYQKQFNDIFSFIKQIPITQAADIITSTRRNDELLLFLAENRKQCRIITDLPSVFINNICNELNVEYYASDALICGNKVQRITRLLDKGAVPSKINGPVVSVGCYDSDAEMISNSDVGIGYGGELPISKSVMNIATYAIYSEDRLCRFLRQL